MEIVPRRLDLVLELEFDLIEVSACFLKRTVNCERTAEDLDIRSTFFADGFVGSVLAVYLTRGSCGRRKKPHIAVGQRRAASTGRNSVVKGKLVKQGRFAPEFVNHQLIDFVRHSCFSLCKCKCHN